MEIKDLTKNQKRFLSRRVCWLCEARLDKYECWSHYRRCGNDVMDARIESCLKTYKPRSPRATQV